MGKGFVHLHCHDIGSALDGLSKPEDLATHAAKYGGAIAQTNHGNLHLSWEFHKRCLDVGAKPIVGLEAYTALESISERPTAEEQKKNRVKRNYHQLLLATGPEGWHSLSKLSSRSFTDEDAIWYKPRLDLNMLAEHTRGLIATTSCLGGITLQHLLHGRVEKARAHMGSLKDIYGDALYAELQDHGLPDQAKTNPQLISLARDMNIPLVAVNDSHYTHRCDDWSHDVLLCSGTAGKLSDPNRFHFHGSEHYLKSPQEMRELFRDYPEACDNTLVIAERVADITIPEPVGHHIPFIDNANEKLDIAVDAGFAKSDYWGDPLYAERLTEELKTIAKLGFSSYFLIVDNVLGFCRKNDIWYGPGRGSAAGSLVVHLMGITLLDPIKYDLSFERFLNESRKTLPDIDIDFETERRQEVFDFIRSEYGGEYAAHICTLSFPGAKSSLDAAARVLELPRAMSVAAKSNLPPAVAGFQPSLADGWSTKGFKRWLKEDPSHKDLLDAAKALEGTFRNVGIHAAGMVITDVPLTDLLPLMANKDGVIATQFPMTAIDDLHILKLDILGLDNLDHMKRVIRKVDGIDHYKDIPLDDPTALEPVREGRTAGLFQLASTGMTDLVKQIQPTTLEDLATAVALYRPGPMQQIPEYLRRRKVNWREAAHPLLNDILYETYGLIVYQEQIMATAVTMAGYSGIEADNLRKGVGKKDRALVASLGDEFVKRVAERHDHKTGKQLWDVIAPAADYSFGRAHSFCYAAIAYYGSWLCHYHKEPFYAGHIATVAGDAPKVSKAIEATLGAGLNVLPPNALAASVEPSVSDMGIHLGLGGVRDVGQAAALLAENLPDSIDKLLALQLKSNVWQALVFSGALDALGMTRQALQWAQAEGWTPGHKSEYETLTLTELQKHYLGIEL